MSTFAPVTALAAAIALSLGGAALAVEPEDHDTGKSLTPGDGAGSWTLESGGHSICVIKLGAQKTGAGAYKLEAPSSCGDALPAGLAGWTPAPGGMNLVDAGGQTLIGFGRWSNSLLVSHRSSGEDIQLKRGT